MSGLAWGAGGLLIEGVAPLAMIITITTIQGMVMGGDETPEEAKPEAAKSIEGKSEDGKATEAQASEAAPATEAPAEAPASHG